MIKENLFGKEIVNDNAGTGAANGCCRCLPLAMSCEQRLVWFGLGFGLGRSEIDAWARSDGCFSVLLACRLGRAIGKRSYRVRKVDAVTFFGWACRKVGHVDGLETLALGAIEYECTLVLLRHVLDRKFMDLGPSKVCFLQKVGEQRAIKMRKRTSAKLNKRSLLCSAAISNLLGSLDTCAI